MAVTLSPYRATYAMPVVGLREGGSATELAQFANDTLGDAVSINLGGPLSPTGHSPVTHRWCSAGQQAASVAEMVTKLAQLAGLPFSRPAWDSLSLAQQVTWTNATLHPALYAATWGGVRLEAAEGDPAPHQLLTDMALLECAPAQPSGPVTDLAWRVRADTGVFPDAGSGTPATVDGSPVAVWDDLGPHYAEARQSHPALQPQWRTNRINGQPAVEASGTQFLLTSIPVSLGITMTGAASAFSVYAVVRFTAVDAGQCIWAGNFDAINFYGNVPPLLGGPHAQFTVNGYLHDFSVPLAAGAWYYLLVTRRASDRLLRLWINGALDPAADINPQAPPDQPLILFATNTEGADPMKGEIAEFGLYYGCVETSGQKAALDAYILGRYGL
jgi:hypothetical protein